MPQIFEVGGKVRDELLGLKSKDADFSFVLTPQEAENKTIDQAFTFMKDWMLQDGFRIFLETQDCLTIRAKFPAPHSALVADFVLARRELSYFPGTRKPLVIPGTLEDDLQRRDFTVNSLARANSGKIIDLFDGQADLAAKVLRTPLPPMVTLADDPLRALRAVRFAVKLGFRLAPDLEAALYEPELPELMAKVSDDRVREELAKAFKVNTWEMLRLLNRLPEALVKNWLERPGLWLMPTTRQ
jgi:tRNA nucleotidyltransferase/poly(A) polymerase